MMPIIDIQTRFRELGRIRTGIQVATGKTYQSGKRKGQPVMRPTKLPRFRLTSAWPHLIDQAAAVFGGEAKPCEIDGNPEFEVVIDAERLPIVIPPGEIIDQWYELWSGGGCARRCDGVRQVLVDRPCSCPSDPIDRQELAAKGEACKPTTRLRVMIPEISDVGIWRLESHGFHAAAELGGSASLVEAASRRGVLIPADLILQAREGARRPGETRKKFFVPAISFRGQLGGVLDALGILDEGAVMPSAVLGSGVTGRPAIDAGGRPQIGSGTTFDPSPVDEASFPAPEEPPDAPRSTGSTQETPEQDPPTLDAGEGFEPTETQDPGSVDIPDPDVLEPPEPEPEPDIEGPTGERALSGPQMIAMRFKDLGFDARDERLRIASSIVGRPISSGKDLNPSEIRIVLETLNDDRRLAEHAAAAEQIDDSDILPGSEFDGPTPLPRQTRRPAPPEPDADVVKPDLVMPPADDTPAQTPPPPAAPQPAKTPGRDPSTWTGAQWREILADRGVKVVAVLRESARLARAAGQKAPSTIDDIAGSGLEKDILGFVEASTPAT